MTGGQVPVTLCTNCRTPLTGRYCANCGQRHEPHPHSVREFLSEAAETITHADSRLWRTLWPLLFKPGFLTCEFVEGRRARYLPPFRLYLVLSVIFFIIAGSTHSDEVRLAFESDAPAAALTRDEPEDQATSPTPRETPQERAKRVCDEGSFEGPWTASFAERLKLGCKQVVVDNGRALGAALLHNIPRALFLLLPLLAVVMSAMYWRRYYVEHLLFFVHNHAFTFVVLGIFLLLMSWTTAGWFHGLLVIAVMLLVPLYTYKAMRRVYGQGRWRTRAKFVVLSAGYFVLVVILAVVTSLYTVVTL